MNGKTASILRNAAAGDRQKYLMLKKLYARSPKDAKIKAKQMAVELAQVSKLERSNAEKTQTSQG